MLKILQDKKIKKILIIGIIYKYKFYFNILKFMDLDGHI
jgi:hypothetical protein